MTQAYIEGFCKAAEAYGVDPRELIKVADAKAQAASAAGNAVAGAIRSSGSVLRNKKLYRLNQLLRRLKTPGTQEWFRDRPLDGLARDLLNLNKAELLDKIMKRRMHQLHVNADILTYVNGQRQAADKLHEIIERSPDWRAPKVFRRIYDKAQDLYFPNRVMRARDLARAPANQRLAAVKEFLTGPEFLTEPGKGRITAVEKFLGR